MGSIFNIISMHAAQDLNERLADEREEQIAKRAAQCADVTMAIRDALDSQEEYDAWWEATPAKGFYNAACDKLLKLYLSPVGEEPKGTADLYRVALVSRKALIVNAFTGPLDELKNYELRDELLLLDEELGKLEDMK